MNDRERQAQVSAQCRAIVHMAKALAEVHEAKAKILDAAERDRSFVDFIGNSTAYLMETLGDILNGMDAVDEKEDAWIDPILEQAHKLWPQPPH